MCTIKGLLPDTQIGEITSLELCSGHRCLEDGVVAIGKAIVAMAIGDRVRCPAMQGNRIKRRKNKSNHINTTSSGIIVLFGNPNQFEDL